MTSVVHAVDSRGDLSGSRRGCSHTGRPLPACLAAVVLPSRPQSRKCVNKSDSQKHISGPATIGRVQMTCDPSHKAAVSSKNPRSRLPSDDRMTEQTAGSERMQSVFGECSATPVLGRPSPSSSYGSSANCFFRESTHLPGDVTERRCRPGNLPASTLSPVPTAARALTLWLCSITLQVWGDARSS